MYFQRSICLIFLALLIGCTSVQKQPSGSTSVYETTLANGLKVLVKPDHRAPVVVSQIWYKVGSSYESKGLTGISHVLEHMMFKGTELYGPNEFSRIIANYGGTDNAFTGRDYTSYFQRLEKSRLPIALELEADRMVNLKFNPIEFKKEVQVVREERRLRTDDRPESLTFERFNSTAFTQLPYRNPIIGWPEDLDALKIEDLKHWYKRFYAPNNATLVVAGDIDAETVFALAEEYFGAIPAQDTPIDTLPVEPKQTKPRTITVEAPAKVPYLIMGYHVPSLSEKDIPAWEPYALEVLAYLLDGSKSARLNKRLIREQEIATAVSASYDPAARLSTLFIIEGNPASGHTMDDLRLALLEQIGKVKKEPITSDELERLKAQILASKVFESDSIFYQGMRLGLFETNGHGWMMGEQFNQNLLNITPEQVIAVAKKYLVENNRTEAMLKPIALSGS